MGNDPACDRHCAATAAPRAHAVMMSSPAAMPMSTPALNESPAPHVMTAAEMALQAELAKIPADVDVEMGFPEVGEVFAQEVRVTCAAS